MSSNTTPTRWDTRAGDPGVATAFDVQKVRHDFPILNQRMHGKPLVYLDNAATTQKPQAVIDAMVRSYAAGQRQYPSRCPSAQRARNALV